MGTLDKLIDRVAREPEQPMLFEQLAQASTEAGRWMLAVQAYRRAFKLGIEATPTRICAFARALTAQGDAARAIELLRAVLVEEPDNVEALFALAPALSTTGDFEHALSVLREVIRRRPDLPEAWEQLTFARHFEDPDDPDIRAMRALATDPATDALMRESLEFALGKSLNDCREFDRAFAHYAAGNRMQRERQAPFSPKAHEQLVQSVIRQFSSARMQRLRKHGSPSARPVFITGMPRSGTTLLEQMLSAHPQVAGAGELSFISSAANDHLHPFPHGLTRLDPAAQNAIGRRYLQDLAHFQNVQHVTDKFPGNLLYIGLIHALFPNAAIIHVRRAPVDNCLSVYFSHFKRRNAYATDLQHIGKVYRHWAQLGEYWQPITEDRLLAVDYENLVNEPEAQLRRVLSHCALPWDSGVLNHERNPRPVVTLSAQQVRQPLYRSSVQRWRHYRAHIGPLLAQFGV